MNIEEKNGCGHQEGRQAPRTLPCLRHNRGTPGNDELDWKPIVKALKSIKYKGDVVIESFTTDVKVIARAALFGVVLNTRDEIAVKGLKFLKKHLSKPTKRI